MNSETEETYHKFYGLDGYKESLITAKEWLITNRIK